MRKKAMVVFLVLAICLNLRRPVPAAQIPGLNSSFGTLTPPAATALPVPKPNGTLQGAAIVVSTPGRMDVNQTSSKAIIDWSSFDIGEGAWTRFNQQGNSDWVALNRIHDKSPSQIFGKLTADGKVYLVNQNGILFGPKSQINVSSMTASTLNIRDEDFLNGVTSFKAEDYQHTGDSTVFDSWVVNRGSIQAGQGGSAFLIAPNVQNQGLISAPAGQIGLAAGKVVSIESSSSTYRTASEVKVKEGPGFAVNCESGGLYSDSGLIGMYGGVVEQDGLARSIVAVKKSGMIELLASDHIITGKNSLTACPITTSDEKVHESFEFQGGTINLGGLSSDSPNAGIIEHYGTLYAPSGAVTLKGRDQVILGAGSKVEVGGIWVEKPVEDNVVETQLNSVELRDSYGQKGRLLQGKVVGVYGLLGSPLADVSGYLSSEQKTAAELATAAGSLNLYSEGDIVVEDGAEIGFTGGGIKYGDGYVDTTKLLSGNRVYDISSAPQWVSYESIIDSENPFEVKYEQFGVTEKYIGLYTGGATPIRNFSQGYLQGDDAGSMLLVGKKVSLGGKLDGSAQRGMYQTLLDDPVDANGNLAATGLRIPHGGRITLGLAPDNPTYTLRDSVVDQIIVQKTVTPTGDEGDLLISYLSTDTLNAAGLSYLDLYANTGIQFEAGAAVTLQQGGALTARARRIEHFGEINVPSGKVRMSAIDNITTDETINGASNPKYVDLQERIFLGEGSIINVSGQAIDNALVGKKSGATLSFGLTTGGEVNIENLASQGDAVIMRPSAVIDVSGGYSIDTDGKITGGDAGTLTLSGPALFPEGTLLGYSLANNKGGTISFHASTVSIANQTPSLPGVFLPDAEIPEELKGRLVLGADLLSTTGFSNIAVSSYFDLTVDTGVVFSPSMVKLATPLAGAGVARNYRNFVDYGPDSIDTASGLITVTPEYLGSSSISLEVSLDPNNPVNQNSRLILASGSRIAEVPGGSINLTGPFVDVLGTLDAPAGAVTLTSTFGDLTLGTGSMINAGGVAVPLASTITGSSNLDYNLLAGGTVTLKAAGGNIDFQAGSFIDVSGSPVVETTVLSVGGEKTTLATASAPGTVNFSYYGDLALNGDLAAHRGLNTLNGGTVSLSTLSTEKTLVVSGDQIVRFAEDGFDAMWFKSLAAIELEGRSDGSTAVVGRQLVLDAPTLKGPGEGLISFQSPWVRLRNTYSPVAPDPVSGNSSLLLSGDWIDVEGKISLSDFQYVELSSKRDLRLADTFYSQVASTTGWAGGLRSACDLTLGAARIYPSDQSVFTIDSAGTVTTRYSGYDTSGAVLSAGGQLTIKAQNINHNGYITAPMGRIVLDAGEEGRVFLAEGSLLRTGGSIAVQYGEVQDGYWTISDRNAKNADARVSVDAIPENSIVLQGKETIAMKGSTIDFSGGGQIYGYQFLSGLEGTENPLTKETRYVILADNSIALPGKTITVEGSENLAAGTYYLLPEECAFLPGAMILTAVKGNALQWGSVSSAEGYSLVRGYSNILDTSISSTTPTYYSVRTAESVLAEGHFDTQTLSRVDAGLLTIDSDTTIFSASLLNSHSSAGSGGSINLSGTEVIYGGADSALPGGFGFWDEVPEAQKGKLEISAETLSNNEFHQIQLGDLGRTETVTLAAYSSLNGDLITLSASKGLTLETGANVAANELSLVTPDGKLTVGDGATARASGVLSINADEMALSGDFRLDGGVLNVVGKNVYLTPSGYSGDTSGALYLTDRFWSNLGSAKTINLSGTSTLNFLGDVNLSFAGDLTLDTPRMLAVSAGDGSNAQLARIAANNVVLTNSRSAYEDKVAGGSGEIDIFAGADSEGYGGSIYLSHGAVALDGFGTARLAADRDIVFKGKGSFRMEGDLAASAVRLTTSYYSDAATAFESLNYQVSTGDHRILVNQTEGTPGGEATAGGQLSFTARSIELFGLGNGASSLVDAPSSYVGFTATGSGPDDGIFLTGAAVSTRGTSWAPGGLVSLVSDKGSIHVDANSFIDVSADTGKAGTIFLSALEAGVFFDGRMAGTSNNGFGGSFYLDTSSLSYFRTLTDKLDAGGFHNAVGIRTRNGDLVVEDGMTLRAHEVVLTADSGNIGIQDGGTIDASDASGGGRVALYAGKDVTLESGGRIDARGTGEGASGGEVTLSSMAHVDEAESGWINLDSGSVIDVSGTAEGGTVRFWAQRTDSDVNMRFDNAHVLGASRIEAVANRAYEEKTEAIDLTARLNDARTFMVNADGIEDRLLSGLNLGGAGVETLHLLPGIEIQSEGNLSFNSSMDLSFWRFDGEAGMLTIRSGGNLSIKGNLVDGGVSNGTSSWGMNLIAGADLKSAYSMAVKSGTGVFSIADGTKVYTKNAGIRFASGSDTLIGSGSQDALRFNIGTNTGDIEGHVGGNLVIKGGAVQSVSGDIDITAARDLVLSSDGTSLGSIRTLGKAATATLPDGMPTGMADLAMLPDTQFMRDLANSILVDFPAEAIRTGKTVQEVYESHKAEYQRYVDGRMATYYWLYKDGGNINLNVRGNVNPAGNMAGNAWDYAYSESNVHYWGANYNGINATQGIVSMAGGDVSIRAGENVFAQAGTFGKGDLSIVAGGDVYGRFVVKDGTGEIQALGSVISLEKSGVPVRSVIEAFDAQIDVTTQGNIDLGTVVNPTLVTKGFQDTLYRSLQYGEDASVTLTSMKGDVSIYGRSDYYGTMPEDVAKMQGILPGTLTVSAAGDIRFYNSIALAPSSHGNLTLQAGGSIEGIGDSKPAIYMSDAAPEAYYASYSMPDGYTPNFEVLFNQYTHGAPSSYGSVMLPPLHGEDTTPVEISSGTDISNLRLFLPKETHIYAANDINNIYLVAQNTRASDVSYLIAGHDIALTSEPLADGSTDPLTGIEVGGPGYLFVEAGNNMDLGLTSGIRTVGNAYNTALDAEGSSLIVAVGYQMEAPLAADGSEYPVDGSYSSIGDFTRFFEQLSTYGEKYSTLMAEGKVDEARATVETARRDLIAPFLKPSGQGNIEMVSSQMTTVNGGDLYVMSAGDMNIGVSTFTTESQKESTGINTQAGGNICAFVEGDFNVNESRVMTWLGGDINVWSNSGDINAGRGSKTAVNTGKSQLVKVGDNWVLQRRPASVGSGLRALTYDPDGLEGPIEEPAIGDIYLFAPSGVIDAAEAGIAGGKVTLGATEIRNVQNISFTFGSVGMPKASDSGVAFASLSGISSLTDQAKMLEQATGLGSAGNQLAQQNAAMTSGATSWFGLSVKVVGFYPEDEDSGEHL